MLGKGLRCVLRLMLPGIGSLLAGSPVAADRASLTVEQSVIGQTNVLHTPDDEQSDGSYEVRPRLRFERPEGDFSYQLEYAPTYDYYFETEGINGFDQYGVARLSYSPRPTGTVSAHTDLAYYRSIRSDTVTGPSGVPELTPDVAGRVFRALADLGYEHELTPTTVAKGTIAFLSYDYSTSTNADSIGAGGELDVVNELTQTLAVGLFGAASHRRFDEIMFDPESSNTVVQTGPVLRLKPAPTWTLEGRAGPAWIWVDRDDADDRVVPRFRTTSIGGVINAAVFDGCGTFAGQPLLGQCPLIPAGGSGDFLASQFATIGPPPSSAESFDEEYLDGFARLLVRKDEEWGYGSLEYFRGEDGSSGSGATSVRDAVTATIELVALENWSLRMRGHWNRRETRERFDRTETVAGQSPEPDPSGSGLFFAEAQGLVVVERSRREVTQYWADARLRRQITLALSADLAVRYLYQDRSGAFSDTEDFDDLRGIFTLRYALPAIDY